MCGIAGQLKFNGQVDQDLVKKMTKVLTHRGPDEDGFYFKNNLGLGIRRLKIIDLETGAQPIHNQEQTVWTVLNGEIYNFQSWRKILQNKGYKFYTKSDTEVIVHLYDEYGEDFIKHLNGMFGLALWDNKKQKLILARDRAGEKPLYYYQNKDSLVFASELKSILEDKNIKKDMDHQALHYYMIYGRVPSPLTIINGVKKLKPAQMLIIDDQGSKIKDYWELSFKDKLKIPEDEIKKMIIGQLEESVKSRMVSDVPLGAFLSGGVDSSAVVAMMAKNSSKPIETFSVGFKEEDFSELRYARIVAKKFKTNHHEFIIEPNVLEVLPKLAWHLDEPFADASIIPTYYVAKTARDFVTVALTGDGADELFAGYEWYKALRLAINYGKLGVPIKNFLYRLAKLLPDTDNRESMLRYVHKFKRLTETQKEASGDMVDIFATITAGFTDSSVMRLYQPELQKELKNTRAIDLRKLLVKEYDGNNQLEAILYSQFKTLLPDMFFTKVDRCSMAVSLETRAPLADYKFVELAARIPFDYKLKGNKTKYIFKEALREYLPEEILFRHKKGFSIPLNRWIKEGQLKDFVQETVFDKSAISQKYFNQIYLKEMIDNHNSGKENNFEKIWRVVMLELWHQEFK